MSRINDVLMLVGKLNYTWTNTESLFIYLIAHLLNTNKEAATVHFITSRMTREQRLRNKYNHCIYSFDETGALHRPN